MMNKPDFLDDIAKIAGGAAGTLNSLRQQLKNDVKARVEDIAQRMDLVPREDLDRVESLLTHYKQQQDALETRLAVLEKLTKKA